MARMTIAEKKKYFDITLRVIGLNIPNKGIADCLVEIYDRMLETGGKVGLSEINEIKERFIVEPKEGEAEKKS